MDPQHWQLAKSIFRKALDLPASDRETFIANNCQDTAVRDEILQMVKLHENDSDFLESPIGVKDSVSERPHRFSADSLIGAQIDDFQIIKRIGSGGVGTVFQAIQCQPQRPAAVKVLNFPTALSGRDLRRFEHEAEILGRLQHPGIAQVYSAGWHDFGYGEQPWFAMELISGRPLHQVAEETALTTREKIPLLLSICDAVQHAHSRGIIHRDLKPANILIVENESDPAAPIGQPKIVDFGVARVTDSDRQATMQTIAGDILGTLNYMCPEQVAADPSLIDERCDVYALGVIGFELLAGQLPHDRQGPTLAASLRRVEEDSPKLLGAVNPVFRGDLQVIIDKAIAKDPDRRYASVLDFAADLRRFLAHRPIQARPASVIYRVGKFISRHRTLVGGTAATFAALIMGIVLYAGEARNARTAAAASQYEADKATAINNFMTNDFLMKLLAAAHEMDGSDRLPTVELVHRAAENIGSMFGDRPIIEAAVRNEVGTIYYNLRAFDDAAAEFDSVLQLWQAELGPDHPDTLKAVNNLAQSYVCLGRRTEAERLFRRALAGRIQQLGEANSFTLATMNNLAQLLQSNQRLDEAEKMFRRVLQLQEASLGGDDKNSIATMINLGRLLIDNDNVQEALDFHRTAFEVSCRSLGEDHLMALQAGSRYAQTLYRAGNYDEGLSVLVPIEERFLRLYGPAADFTVTARRVLARIYRRQGNTEKAMQILRSALNELEQHTPRPTTAIERIQRDLRLTENSNAQNSSK